MRLTAQNSLAGRINTACGFYRNGQAKNDKKEISIRELDEKAKEQGISGRTMRDVRSRMKNELEYQVNEKQENSIRLKE